MSSNDKSLLANFYQKTFNGKDKDKDSSLVAANENTESSSDEDFVCESAESGESIRPSKHLL